MYSISKPYYMKHFFGHLVVLPAYTAFCSWPNTFLLHCLQADHPRRAEQSLPAPHFPKQSISYASATFIYRPSSEITFPPPCITCTDVVHFTCVLWHCPLRAAQRVGGSWAAFTFHSSYPAEGHCRLDGAKQDPPCKFKQIVGKVVLRLLGITPSTHGQINQQSTALLCWVF